MFDPKQCVKCHTCKYYDTGCSRRNTWERLKAVEDILGWEYDLDRLRELVEADRDGRLVVLPCKVGDKAYWVHDGKITDCHVHRIQLNRKGLYVVLKREYVYGAFAVDRIGKDVFMSREEAEAALEGMGNNG